MESVSGLPIQVDFINVEDIKAKGIPRDVSVIINAGAEGDAWSGGECWADPKVIEAVCEFVRKGGGFIGVGEPSALRRPSSRYFQLAELLGVDRELGLTRAFDRLDFALPKEPHFILKDAAGELDFGPEATNIFILSADTSVLAARGKSPLVATKAFGRGRSVYLAGHKYAMPNVRLLHRAIFFAAAAEAKFAAYTCTNVRTECAYYPRHNKLAVVNNGTAPEQTRVTLADGKSIEVKVEAYGATIVDA
jgi:beta-D-galactosyl-(1->4)-L-rhamnose phosphorylase